MTVTTNPKSVVQAVEFSVQRTIQVAAPIDAVWSAITVPEHISRWFGQVALNGAGAGASGTISWPDHGAIPLKVEAIEAPRMVSYRWGNDGASGIVPATLDPAHSTVFTFTLESVGDGTQLTVVETGFETSSDPVANMEDHRGGWDAELDKLVALFEDAS